MAKVAIGDRFRWKAVWLLVEKELRGLIRDSRTFVVLLGIPILFVAILGFSTGQIFTGRTEQSLDLAMVNLDAGDLSHRVLDELALGSTERQRIGWISCWTRWMLSPSRQMG